MRCALAAALVASQPLRCVPQATLDTQPEGDRLRHRPADESDMIQLLTDSDEWLKYTDITIDYKGKTWKTSWSGLQDGTMTPVLEWQVPKATFKTEDRSSHMMGMER